MKTTKNLWRVSVTTMREAEDAVAEMLAAALNRAAVSHFNMETGVSTVMVYCEGKLPAGIREIIAAGLAQIKKCGLKIGGAKIKITKVRREDWAESWKRHFKPLEINFQNRRSGLRGNQPKSLLIKPGWSKKRPRRNQAVVVLNPGLSFGTGQHATTGFCLSEIVRLQTIASRPSFLDIGCGSGILAIAAAKLGYAPIRALDFDVAAVRIARVNARANRVPAKLKISHSGVEQLPLRPAQRYDVVCANLISNLLIAERRRIVAQLNRGGVLVLAGILKSEFWEVQSAFEKLGLKLVCAKTEKEWRSGSFCFA